ncbi:unnamed protein product [Musa textilis]
MGCVCSSRSRSDRKERKDGLYAGGAEEAGTVGDRKSNCKLFNSGELRVVPAKAVAGKVLETSSILGRASIAGLEKAVEVLDTLGSTMSNLNPSSGFTSGVTARGYKISILAFEVANTIAKGANLWRSLTDENINILKEEVLQSDGVRKLISTDANELLWITAADKREELDFFSREVIRFGNLCKDPIWHNLGRYFEKLSLDMTPAEQSKEEVEMMMQLLLYLAQSTSELYHELHALDRYEQDYRRKLQEEELIPAARQESLLNGELKRQKKLVKSLKKKSLWSRNLEEVVEKLVDIVTFLYKQIWESFKTSGCNLLNYKPAQNQTLGASGLALHYANIINQIDNIVSRPLSLPPTTRDSLYQGLPTRVKAALRTRLQSFDAKEEYTVAQIKAEMQKILCWISPIAENTTRAHQGFGWVGEWATMGTEINKKPDMQNCIARIQTLHHANKEKTEEYILELVVWLHHLVIQVKNRGYGLTSGSPVQSQSNKGTVVISEPIQEPSQACNGRIEGVQLSKDERNMLEQVNRRKITLGRSKSLDSEKRARRHRGRSRSCENSPDKEFSVALDCKLERSRVLDVMDGLSTLRCASSSSSLLLVLLFSSASDADALFHFTWYISPLAFSHTIQLRERDRSRMMRCLSLVLVLSPLFLAVSDGDGDGDHGALVKLKAALVGPGGSGLGDWAAASPDHCSFSGVTCDEDSHVVALNVSFVRLNGSLPPEIGLLRHLVNLTVSCAGLGGSLPVELAALPSLRFLNISNNNFSADFPKVEPGGFPALEVIDAYNNNISGPLPLGLAAAPLLRYLHLGGNFFSGVIPEAYSDIPNLEYLGLNGNSLTGHVPPSLCRLSKLKEMYIGYFNVYEGGIPREFGRLSSLVRLDMAECGLSGTIPASLGQLNRLNTLFLQDNRLSGSIPPELGGLSQLEFLDFSINELTGEIPESFAELKELKLLSLFQNHLRGIIPTFIGELPSLVTLQLWENNFSSELPESLGMNGRLVTLDVASNRITGTIPPDLCASGRLEVLVLMDNGLVGPIPEMLGGCTSLTWVRLGKNALNGSIPAGLFDLPFNGMLELNDNNLSGELPTVIAGDKLRLLILSNNSITGSIPPAISKLSALEKLELNKNRMFGEIPPEIGRLKALSMINLSGNELTGGFPIDLAHCASLVSVDLSRNRLTGEIPVQITALPNLNTLNLSSNRFWGDVPPEILKMPSLATLDLSNNCLPNLLSSEASLMKHDFSVSCTAGATPGRAQRTGSRCRLALLTSLFLLLLFTR